MKYEELFEEITTWQEQTFSESGTLAGGSNHIHRQAVDLVRAVETGGPLLRDRVADQIADIVILCLWVARCVGVDLLDVIRTKHRLNLERKWREPDIQGVIEHVGKKRC